MATLEQIQSRMKKLQAQAETLLAKQAQAAVDQIRELMLKHGLTTADIEARAKAKREAKTPGRRLGNGIPKPAASAKGKLPPKYRDPKTGATWSGHARPPAWIKNMKDRTRFLIDEAASIALDAADGASKAAAAAGKVSAKRAAGKRAAAKKAVVETAAVKKPAAKKAAAKKPAAKKTAAAKPAVAKKAVRAKATATTRAMSRAATGKATSKDAAASVAA